MPATEPTAVAAERPAPTEGRGSLLRQWPLLLGMVLLWCAVWQDFSPHVMLTGVVFSLLVQVLFPMPPVPFGDRFHPGHALVFTGRFLWDVVRSSVSVAGVILTQGRRVRSSVVRVPLRSHDDIVLTLVSHALALVPGSIVLDVDRAGAVLYLHVLDVHTDAETAAYRATALDVEAGIIRAVGSREDMDLLRAHPHSAPSSEGMADRRRHPAYRTELLPDTPGPAGPTDAERGGPR
ncbi:Na+/H+ antiporter subunit E [Micrococcus lacusdianchii]|uniref:Na+/H+ antiporter subunit E n=1 Tax=Micrococcus lacusdianchii TaxID=2915940 RepID=UPI002003F88F|nr:Na+/H+ antiporter subunit E [Micrococcus sp. JXJ CY 30]